jgi:hypothetical protein
MCSTPSGPHGGPNNQITIHVCQAILETGSGRKLSHNGCTAGNFDLPDHGFFTSDLLHRSYGMIYGEHVLYLKMFVHVSALEIYTVRLSIRPLIGVNNVKPMSGGRLK